jgi:hypothetical protein
VGAAAVAAGAIWYLVRRKRERPTSARLAAAPARGGVLLQATGSF